MEHIPSEKIKEELERLTDNIFRGGELREIEGICRKIRGARSFVDAGANRGQYTWAANLVLEDADILAIEANPFLAKEIGARIDNGTFVTEGKPNRLRVKNCALSDTSGDIQFRIDPNDELNSSIADIGADGSDEDDSNLVSVGALTLDELCPGEPPEFVKIDIEGAEWRAIVGSRRILSKRQTSFLIEIHPWGDQLHGKKSSDVLKEMNAAGYSVERLGRLWFFSPVDPGLSGSLKSLLYGIILDYPVLRKLAKSLVGRG